MDNGMKQCFSWICFPATIYWDGTVVGEQGKTWGDGIVTGGWFGDPAWFSPNDSNNLSGCGTSVVRFTYHRVHKHNPPSKYPYQIWNESSWKKVKRSFQCGGVIPGWSILQLLLFFLPGMFRDVPQLPKNPTGVLHVGCSPNAISMGVSWGKFVGLHGNQSNKHIFLDWWKHMGSAASDQKAYLEKKQRLNFEQGKKQKRATWITTASTVPNFFTWKNGIRKTIKPIFILKKWPPPKKHRLLQDSEAENTLFMNPTSEMQNSFGQHSSLAPWLI